MSSEHPMLGYYAIVESEEEDNPRRLLSGTYPKPAAQKNAREAMGNGANSIWTATKFVPPVAETPQHIFPARSAAGTTQFQRFCLRRRYAHQFPPSGISTMCIFTDGACINNGSTDIVPQAGCAFVFNNNQPSGTVGFPLEKEGPDGQVYAHTSNRAELRAVIAALEFRCWFGEGWQRVVIVTDSEYVAKGATEWMRVWAGQGWLTASGTPVKNRDLWEKLNVQLGDHADGGCEVSFWAVPREWNQQADRAAGDGARQEPPQSYTPIMGVLC